ncbi:MAG: hypothetical protein HN530_06610 [Gammaproteobacteria bacterium]|nr:hypothetical protein [Gammaproteobacteria bacterium]
MKYGHVVIPSLEPLSLAHGTVRLRVSSSTWEYLINDTEQSCCSAGYQKRQGKGISQFRPCSFVVSRRLKAVAHAPFLIGVGRRLQRLQFCLRPLLSFEKLLNLSKPANSFNGRFWWAHQETDAALGSHPYLKVYICRV